MADDVIEAQADEPDMSWVDIAVCGPGHCVVTVDCAPGLFDFIDELFFEDNFAIEAPMHLAPGLYRWSGYRVGTWEEGDLINITGGEFGRLALASC